MGYKVDYAALQDLLGAYSSAVSEWGSGISSVLGKEQAIEASANISGHSADRMKAYLSAAYSYAATGLGDLLNTFQSKFLLYMNAYCQQVDPAGDTSIDEAEQNELHSDLSGKRTELQNCATSAETSAKSVADLVALPNLDFGGPDAAFGSLLTSLDELDNAVNGLESAHVSGDFTEIDALLSGMEGFFQDLMGQGEDFKTGFSAAAFGALSSVPALYTAIQEAETSLAAQQGEVSAAVNNIQILLEERAEREQAEMERLQAEYEARAEKAKWAKIGAGIVVGTLSAVAIAATGGVAAAVVIGAAAGMTKSAFNAAADEYVKYGFDTDQWDVNRIGVSACMGGISGAVTGLLPPGANYVAKAGVKGVTSALTSGVMETYDQYAANGKITDAKAIFGTAAKKGVTSFVGEVAGGAVTENVKYFGIERLDNALDDPLNGLHTASVFLKEGVKDLGSGVVERGVSNVTGQVIDLSADGTFVKLDEIDYEGVAKDMFAPEELVGDFVGGGMKGAAKDYVSLRTPDMSGRTPIIQYKLGNTTDPETGETPIIQEALSHMVDEDEFQDVLQGMEERNPSTGANATFASQGPDNTTGSIETYPEEWDSIDWEHTSNTPEELRQIQEMEENGEFDIKPSEMGRAYYYSKTPPLTEKPIEVTFNYDPTKYDVEEFYAQGDMQEAGMNQLTVAEYLDNYERYQAEGRAPDDMQQLYREGIVETMAYEDGISVEEARERISGSAALHNPDQIAGGDPNNIYALGSSDVNSSYGSQWRSRSESLYQEVRRASEGMTREEMENTRINVRFNYESKIKEDK